MSKKDFNWELLSTDKPRNAKEIVETLLTNRGLNTNELRKEFMNPRKPSDLSIAELGINKKDLDKSVERIRQAISVDEQIIIYGDYDADGVCSTAILWESLYSYSKKVTPYLPDRFLEGYGINPKSVEKIKQDNPDLKLIITVDNGIVANAGIEKAKELGIDVIITDHHQKGEKYPDAYSIVHTDKIAGSGIAWILAREVAKKIKIENNKEIKNSLELAAIGTIADQLPLIGPNRSIAKYGLQELNETSRTGLLALFEEAGIKIGTVGTYEVNYLIAPRINAMGRLKNAMDSLRLLCTGSFSKARSFAMELGRTNRDRQEIVDNVLVHARELAIKTEWKGVIVLAHESYHEGVIGLAAGKLVEEFGRPAIVLSKGLEVSKASARSISGFNIIENIRKMDAFILGGGGHPMAAGFSIETAKIDSFIQEFDKLSEPLLTSEILQKRIKIDCEVDFPVLNDSLYADLVKFEPTGMGNPVPIFTSQEVKINDVRTVGSDGKHLKLKLQKENISFDAIYFNGEVRGPRPTIGQEVSVAYTLDENIWNGMGSLQLKVKDIHLT